MAEVMFPSRSYAEIPADPVIAFDPSFPDGLPNNPHIIYGEPSELRYVVHVPANYKGDEPFGLLVMTNPEGLRGRPGWETILAQHHLIVITAQIAKKSIPEMMGAQVFGVFKMREKYKIDPARIYTIGEQLGCMTAGSLPYYTPSVFRGVIELGDIVVAASAPPTGPNISPAYRSNRMVVNTTAENLAAAQKDVKFAIVTAKGNPAEPVVSTAFHTCMEKDFANAKLFDLASPNPRVVSDPNTLGQVIDYFDGKVTTPTSLPAAPAWLAKDFTHWPQILLENQFRAPLEKITFRGAGAFLTRLPDGRVVGMTARHIFDNHPALGQFDSTEHKWYLQSRVNPDAHVLLGKLVVDPAEMGDIDFIAASAPPTQKSFPAQTLPARTTLLDIGETVYLVGVPNVATGRQNVYKGEVLERQSDKTITFQIDGRFETSGLSGSPVIDSHGNLAGIYVAHLNDQKVPGKLQVCLIEMAEILTHIMPAASSPAH